MPYSIVRKGPLFVVSCLLVVACGSGDSTTENVRASKESQDAVVGDVTTADTTDNTVTLAPAPSPPEDKRAITDDDTARGYLAQIVVSFGVDPTGEVAVGTADAAIVLDYAAQIGDDTLTDNGEYNLDQGEYLILVFRKVDDSESFTVGGPGDDPVPIDGDTIIVAIHRGSGLEVRRVVPWEQVSGLVEQLEPLPSGT